MALMRRDTNTGGSQDGGDVHDDMADEVKDNHDGDHDNDHHGDHHDDHHDEEQEGDRADAADAGDADDAGDDDGTSSSSSTTSEASDAIDTLFAQAAGTGTLATLQTGTAGTAALIKNRKKKGRRPGGPPAITVQVNTLEELFAHMDGEQAGAGAPPADLSPHKKFKMKSQAASRSASSAYEMNCQILSFTDGSGGKGNMPSKAQLCDRNGHCILLVVFAGRGKRAFVESLKAGTTNAHWQVTLGHPERKEAYLMRSDKIDDNDGRHDYPAELTADVEISPVHEVKYLTPYSQTHAIHYLHFDRNYFWHIPFTMAFYVVEEAGGDQDDQYTQFRVLSSDMESHLLRVWRGKNARFVNIARQCMAGARRQFVLLSNKVFVERAAASAAECKFYVLGKCAALNTSVQGPVTIPDKLESSCRAVVDSFMSRCYRARDPDLHLAPKRSTLAINNGLEALAAVRASSTGNPAEGQ